MKEIIDIIQPAPSRCQIRIMNGPIRGFHFNKECIWFPLHMTCLTLSGVKTHRGARRYPPNSGQGLQSYLEVCIDQGRRN